MVAMNYHHHHKNKTTSINSQYTRLDRETEMIDTTIVLVLQDFLFVAELPSLSLWSVMIQERDNKLKASCLHGVVIQRNNKETHLTHSDCYVFSGLQNALHFLSLDPSS